MGIPTFRASEQGRVKIKQARESKGWVVREEDNTPLKAASKLLIRQYAAANQWLENDRRWLLDFERLFRVEPPQTSNEIKAKLAQSKQGSLLERIEQSIDAGDVLAKDISYGSWNRFASQKKSHAIKVRAFKAYCQVLGLQWQEIVEHDNNLNAEKSEEEQSQPLNLSTQLSNLSTFQPANLPTSQRSNLPVRYHTALIGRETEMTQLLELLSCDRPTHHISIEGIGGAGKTSLVLEAAYQCLQATSPSIPKFDAIIFTSAKQQHLIGNHILQRHRRERTLNDIFRTIFRTLDASSAIPADFDEQLEDIQRRLQDLHTLLIVDNLETLDDQEAVLSFLYELPPTVKIVITTRVRGAFGVPIYLEGLPVDAATRLMQHQAQEQRVSLKPEQFQVIYQRTHGLPLGIVYAIGQLSVYGSSADIVTTGFTLASNDLTHYCFEDSVQRLRGQLAHRLLMALALFSKSASRDAIAQIALPEIEASQENDPKPINHLNAFAQLYKLRLVMQREERYDMHPLTRQYALTELKAYPEFEQPARERWVNWYLQLSQIYGQEDWKQWHDYQNLDQEWENLQAAIDWCIQQNRYEQVRQFWQHIKGYTYVRGYWHERLIWIDWLLQAAEQHQDTSMMAEVLLDKGWTLTLMGKPEQLAAVDALFAQVLSLQEGEDLVLHLELTIDRAVLSIHQRNFARSQELLNQGKELLQRVQLEESKRLRQEIRIHYYEAEVWFRTGNYQQAKIAYQQALAQAQVIQWQQVEVYSLNWLADVALVGEGNLEEAEYLLNTSMPIAVARKDKRSIVFHQRSWACLEKMRGNISEFQRWVMDAKTGFESLGMLAEAQEMQSWLDAI